MLLFLLLQWNKTGLILNWIIVKISSTLIVFSRSDRLSARAWMTLGKKIDTKPNLLASADYNSCANKKSIRKYEIPRNLTISQPPWQRKQIFVQLFLPPPPPFFSRKEGKKTSAEPNQTERARSRLRQTHKHTHTTTLKCPGRCYLCSFHVWSDRKDPLAFCSFSRKRGHAGVSECVSVQKLE